MTDLESYQMRCPSCGGIAESDHVDIGVGTQVRGNFYCPDCHWAKPTLEKPADLGLLELDDES